MPASDIKVGLAHRHTITVDDSLTVPAVSQAFTGFVEWCEQERMSYREGFDRLVAKIERS